MHTTAHFADMFGTKIFVTFTFHPKLICKLIYLNIISSKQGCNVL